MSFCPDCGIQLDKDDTFCRKCGKSLKLASKPRPASVEDLAKIAGIQEKIKEYGSASNWMLFGGGVISLLSAIYFSYSFLVLILVNIPFVVLSAILTYYKYKLQRKLEKGELD